MALTCHAICHRTVRRPSGIAPPWHAGLPRTQTAALGGTVDRTVGVILSDAAIGPANAIPVADMVTAFHYVFGAATALLACAALSIILMEERPLAGPSTPAEMAE